MMAGLGDALGFDVDTPWRKLPAKARKAILEGSDQQVHVRYRNRYGRTRSYYADFEGVLAFLQLTLPAFVSGDPDHGVVDQWVPTAAIGAGILY